MNQISNAISEIGNAEANLDSDEAKERLSAQDVTAAQLDNHKDTVEVSDSAILQRIDAVKDLVSQLGENSTETEAQVLQAIAQASGGDAAKAQWLAGELGIDISKLDAESNDLFGQDDLASAPGNVELPAEYFQEATTQFRAMIAAYPELQGPLDPVINTLNSSAYTVEEKANHVLAGLQSVTATISLAENNLEGLQGQYRAQTEAKINAVKAILAEFVSTPAAPTVVEPSTPTAPSEAGTEAAETASEQQSVYAALAQVLRSPSSEPDAIKAKLVEALKEVDNVGQFLDQLMSSLSDVEGIPGLTDGSAEALITRTGLDTAVAALKTQFGSESLTDEQAESVAEQLMSGAAALEAAQASATPFEITPLTSDQLASRATNVASFPGVAESPTQTLQASNVAQVLKDALDKAITDKNMDAFRDLAGALGLVINETDVNKVINHINENRAAIDQRITDLSQAVDGKTQADIQAVAAEANRAQVDALLSSAAREFPEHVGTARWNNWVRKLASGETQKSFAEYLNEDEPVQGLETIMLMIKKFIMQFKDLMSGLKDGEESLGERLQGEVDKARDLINQAHLERVGAEFGMTPEQIQSNQQGLEFYQENEALFESLGENLSIREIADVDGNGSMSKAELIKYLQDNPDDREDLQQLLMSTEEKPYMTEALKVGYSLDTLGALAKFTDDPSIPEDRRNNLSVSVENGQITLAEAGGESVTVDLNAGKENDLIAAMQFFVTGADQAPDQPEAEQFLERSSLLSELITAGKVVDTLNATEAEKLFDGEELNATFKSLFDLPDKYWDGYQLTESDINKIIEHRDKGSIDNGDVFAADGDSFDVDGAWDERVGAWRRWTFDRNFESVEEFVNWLDHPNNNQE